MRAGLLSQPEVIQQINDTFVSTWILIDHAEQRAAQGDVFARTLALSWEYPLDLVFLSPEGMLITKLNSFKHLRNASGDVGHPPEGRGLDLPHRVVFQKLINQYFAPDG